MTHRSIAAAVLLASTSGALADNVLLLTSGNSTWDMDLFSALVEDGHTVALGPQYWELTGNENLDSYDVLFACFGPNYANFYSLSEPTQQMLVDFVQSGGGFVTTEWYCYNMGVYGVGATLEPITGEDLSVYNGYRSAVESVTYTVETADPVLTAGLPASFSFVPDEYAGTELNMTPRAGATAFLSSDSGFAGVIGMDAGRGRVLHFSTVVGSSQIADPSFRQLIKNSVNWAGVADRSRSVCGTDVNGDGVLDNGDIWAFVAAFLAGC